MRKFLTPTISILIMLFIASSMAFPWGSATHAYIADSIGKNWGLMNKNEVYGAMLPDLFNYDFTIATDPCLRSYTHGLLDPWTEDFRMVWEEAGPFLQRNLAFGFVSHNDLWGADSTAHVSSRTLANYEGWIISKEVELLEAIETVFNGLGLFPDPGPPPNQDYFVCRDFCHNLLEAAGDIIIKRNDPLIGHKIISASLLRTPTTASLLTSVINCPGVGPQLIIEAEAIFRQIMTAYGGALMQDEANIIQIFAEDMAGMALEKLEAFEYPVPPVGDPAREVFKAALKDAAVIGLEQSLLLIENDYMKEIKKTIQFVRKQMRWNGITY